VEERIEADLALGRHAELIGELEALIAEEPHRERLRRQLMLALYRSDRQTDALQAYRDARTALDELGVEPGTKLRQLEKQILTQDPALDLPAVPQVDATAEGAPARSGVASRGRPQRKLVTVVVAAVTGSSELGDALDPEALRNLLGALLERVRAAAERHGGLVEESAGDAVLAVFGLPAVHEDDALRALRAAVEIREAMTELGIEGRVGVDSGEALVGAPERLVTGHPLTAASRLAQAADTGEILVGEGTIALAGEAVRAEPHGRLPLKGKQVPVWRLVSVSAEPLVRRFDSPFVGREAELAMLSEAWERMRAEGGCELVTVVGAAGVGKSRLVAELLARVEATVARGRCPSYGAGITYWPVVEVLTQLRPALAGLDPAVAAPLAALIDDSSTASTGELAWAFRKLVEAAARERPLIVVFDDIQWAEEALLELIEHVALVSSGAPILLLCMARPELLERRPGWQGQLPLEPLSRQETEQLIQARLGGDSKVTERIVTAAGGNPLFAEELSAMLHDTADEQLPLPPTIQALLAARLDQLDEGERAVLEAAAIEGEVFHLGAVQALTPDKPGLTEQLTALVRKELLRPDRAALEGEDAFRFRHLLLRETAYDAIPKTARATLHERYADWLGQHAEAMDASFVGYHLERAYRYRTELAPLDDETRALGERAATHLAASAQRAGERGDHHAAANLLERALAVGLADPHKRTRSQLDLVALLGMLGRPAERDSLLAEVVDTATRLGDPALIMRARMMEAAGIVSNPESDLEVPRKIVEGAVETLSELGDQHGLALADGIYGAICVREGRMADALAHRERALAAAEASGWRAMRRQAITQIAWILVLGPAPVGDAIRRCEELILIDPSDLQESRVSGRMSALVAMAGRAEEALELVERSSRLCDEFTAVVPSLITSDAVAEAKEYAGDRAAAIEEREAQCEKLDEIFAGRLEAWAISAVYKLALLYCDEGRWEDAERRLAYGAELPVPAQFRQEAVLRLAGRARLAAHHGRHDEAVGLATKAVELAEQSDMLNLRGRIWEALAEVQRAAGREAEAAAVVATALALYEQKENVAAAERLRSMVWA
jgi:class 3 adenylate cyclase/tetratricopeptide (TPR) repeat protein